MVARGASFFLNQSGRQNSLPMTSMCSCVHVHTEVEGVIGVLGGVLGLEG